MAVEDFAATDLVGWVESSEPTTLSSGHGGFRRLHPPYKMLPYHAQPFRDGTGEGGPGVQSEKASSARPNGTFVGGCHIRHSATGGERPARLLVAAGSLSDAAPAAGAIRRH